MRFSIFFLLIFCFQYAVSGFNDSITEKPQNSGMNVENLRKVKLIYQINIRNEINAGMWRQTNQAFSQAKQIKPDLIIINLNTYGGAVIDADSIRTKILNSYYPVYVFIDNNAASAGALISLACDSIYMRPGASMGAATVVDQTGSALPDKYQSYMRSIMRATCEAHGRDTIINSKDTTYRWRRDPHIAEAMVDESISIPGIIDTGKVLTMTPDEAIKYGFCEGIREDVKEVIEKAGIKQYEIQIYEPTLLDIIIGFLTNPFVSGLLIMGIIGGIYFEMQAPGIGFPIGVALTAAMLYFAPLYLDGLAANWEILLFIIGLVLIALEIFLLPGFGISGILGGLSILIALTLSLINNDLFDFSNVPAENTVKALSTVIVSLIATIFVSIWIGSRLISSKRGIFSILALKNEQTTSKGYIAVNTTDNLMVGKTGIAETVLRPSGRVFVEGESFDALTEGGFISKGEAVVVTRDESGQLYVKKL